MWRYEEAQMKRELAAAENAKLKLQIETWQKELVNLTRRNRLLYFKHTKSATLEITAPHADTVWKTLLNGGWHFYSPPEPKSGSDDTELADVRPARGPKPDELVTDKLVPNDLTRSLRNLERKAGQAYIDTGLKILYLCFEMLRWVDPKDGKPVDSPILLYPVDIVRDATQSSFRLVASEGDPIINPSLIIKLESDFGLDLGLNGDSEDLDPTTVRAALHSAIADQPEWSVEDRVVLGTFTFHREAMYQDLVGNADKAAAEPLIQALAIGPSIAEAYDFEFDPLTDDEMDAKAPPELLVSIGDADSTQRACIVAARDGKTFVMDGPPGTGKSQTITNMIAELLHAGKSVLFVSEKAAALDVVANRLKRVGLEDFVLELHSHKATRKEVAQELGRALTSRPRARSRFGTQEVSDLQRTRQSLNDYAVALNQVRMPLDRSLHQVLGRVVSLHELPRLPTPTIKPDELTSERLGEILTAAGELSRSWGPVERGDRFLWRSMKETQLSGGDRRDIEARVDLAASAANELADRVQAIDNDLGLSWPGSRPDAERLLGFLTALEDFDGRDRTPAAWLSAPDMTHVASSFESAQTTIEQLRTAEQRASEIILVGWELAPTGLTGRLAHLDATAAQVEPSIHPPAVGTATWTNDVMASITDALTIAEAMLTQSTVIADAFGLDSDARDVPVLQLANLAELAQMVDSAARPDKAWLNPVVQSALTEAEDVLSTLVTNYRTRRDLATSLFSPSVLELNLAALKDRMQSTGAFGKMAGTYRSDKKTLVPHVVSGKVNGEVVAALGVALEWQLISEELDTAEARHAIALGTYYPDRETADLDRLNSALVLAQRALVLTGAKMPARLAEQIALDGQPSAAALDAGRKLSEVLGTWNEALPRLSEVGVDVSSMSVATFISWASKSAAYLGDLSAIISDTTSAVGVELGLDQVRQLAENVDAATQARDELMARSDEWSIALGGLFEGESSNLETIRRAIHWVEALRDSLNGPVSASEAARILDLPPHASPLKASVEASQLSWNAILDLFQTEQRVRLASDFDVSFADASELLSELRSTTADLEEWDRHADAASKLQTMGLEKQVRALVSMKAAPSEVLDALERVTLEGWADKIISKFKDLKPISSLERNNLAESFRTLDRAQVAGAAARVINACSENRPTTLAGVAGTIQREAEKKNRHMPIKTLLNTTREVALKLKPCFMMSPLTVSQFLPTDLIFDAVIFDEASQVRPSEAVNCLYRARQVVVAGDPRQLPPTSFFDTSSGSDDDDYDEQPAEDFESILDGFRSSGIPMMPLRWHYRSQHESLITFSNYQFYEGRLHTFPGAIDIAPDVGVELIQANGVYRRGAGRDNPIEARKVVERVLFHRQHHPHLTLGVVAFSSAQESAIADEIDAQAGEHPELNELLTADRLDGFFVKNLENVQGDERDIIIFSIGYGKDENGKFTETLGPLNRLGGERRLNVAITRARRRVEVVSSITSGDFPGTSQARGVRELQRYLAFAEHGSSALAIELGPTDADVESPFEEEVLRTLRRLGYEAEPQVGVAGYRIDLGVRHPEKPGQFVLAVECDGAAYHSSRVARDRDRLRQQVIEGLGWSVHRIWGPSWYRDRIAEEARLKAAIEQSIEVGHTAPPRRTATFEESIEMSYHEAILDDRPTWAIDYEPTQLGNARFLTSEEFADVSRRSAIADTIAKIVECEGPVHEEVARLAVMDHYNIGRMGSRIRPAYDAALATAKRQHGVRLMDRVFFTMDGNSDAVRVAAEDDEWMRKITHIPPTEQRAAITQLVGDSIRIDRGELVQRFSRLFGFRRAGADIQRSFEHQLDELLDSGVLDEAGGAISRSANR